MGIKAFSYFVKSEATPFELKDTTVVIDAQNYLFDLYEKSRLPFTFGCESNKFAMFLKQKLTNFKKANLKCFFVFKGGSKEKEKKFEKKRRYRETNNSNFMLPIFAWNVCKQVLDELKLDYVACPLGAKDYCIAMATKYGCSVISNDQIYPLSKVSYIPHSTMQFNEQTQSFKCGKFTLDDMLRKYNLTDDKFRLFLALANSENFSGITFMRFLRYQCIPLAPFHGIPNFLLWLSRQKSSKHAYETILRVLSPIDKGLFIRLKHKYVINLKSCSHMPLNGDHAVIKNKDPMWFEKGVTNKFIAKQYTYLYYSNVCIYKNTIHSYESNHKHSLSTDILIYAFNLLTNYNKQQFSLIKDTGELITMVDTRTLAVPKPAYTADECVFENGWEEISYLGLFEHFLCGTMKGIDLKYLEEIPEDARVLMITLTYYTVKIPNEMLDELYSILLSYVMLGIVFDDRDDVNIAKAEYELAIDATKNYFKISRTEIECLMDTELYCPLVEFQHCLEEMNYLNALCGFPYKPTIYSKTYNGTFVYKILHSLKTKDLDREDFLVNILKLPPRVYDILQNLSIIHERLLISIED